MAFYTHNRTGLCAVTFISAEMTVVTDFVVGIITLQSLLQILDARVTVCVCVCVCVCACHYQLTNGVPGTHNMILLSLGLVLIVWITC